MSYQAQPPADGAQPRPRWPPRAREEPAHAYQTDDPSTTAQSSSLVPWPAAQPDQVKPENGHHNMMTGPALSPLPAVSPTPVAATERARGRSCRTRTANCPQGHAWSPQGSGAGECGGITGTPLAHPEGCGYDRPDAWCRWVRA